MASPLLTQMGFEPVINASGIPSRLGCVRYPEPVWQAMFEATQCFVPINELQARASEAIVRLTGAESGCATTGAAGALFLGTCALLTGSDFGAMDALPIVQSGRPMEIVVHRTHRNPYDHVVRAAGATLVEFGYSWEGVGAYRWQLKAAINSKTAAVLYESWAEKTGLSLLEVCEIAHEAGVPVLVDAAEVPTARKMRAMIDSGADLIAVSGGKFLQGPAASGILAGRRDLIEAATLQNQDMYTSPPLFTGPFGSMDPRFPEPLHQGAGRMLKLGREQIVGLIAAIELFLTTDHEEFATSCMRVLEVIQREIGTRPSMDVRIKQSAPDVPPSMSIEFGGSDGYDNAAAVTKNLQTGEPRIFVDEGKLRFGVIKIGPHSLRLEEAHVVGRRLSAALDHLGM